MHRSPIPWKSPEIGWRNPPGCDPSRSQLDHRLSGGTSSGEMPHLIFAGDPIWRTYVITYSDGHRLCRAFVAGDDERFARLLVEQLTPADLLNSEIGRSLA